MTKSEAQIEYMTAWVRLHAAGPVDSWTPKHVYQTYMLLRPPAINFSDWVSTANIEIEDSAPTVNEDAVSLMKQTGAKVD